MSKRTLILFSHLLLTAAIMLSNYDALRRRHWETFDRLQLASLVKEFVLANRFSMQDLIDMVLIPKRVCICHFEISFHSVLNNNILILFCPKQLLFHLCSVTKLFLSVLSTWLNITRTKDLQVNIQCQIQQSNSTKL